jgi:hypothetical protein
MVLHAECYIAFSEDKTAMILFWTWKALRCPEEVPAKAEASSHVLAEMLRFKETKSAFHLATTILKKI